VAAPTGDQSASRCPEPAGDFPWIPAAIAAVLGPLLFLGASAFLWPPASIIVSYIPGGGRLWPRGRGRLKPPAYISGILRRSMNLEIETYSKYIRKQIADVHAALKGLSEQQLNRRPDVPGANSGYVIATHILGNARAWVLGIVCEQALRRDRPSEFASSGTYEALGKAACALSGEIDAALAGLDPSTLDDRFLPPQELWGEGEAQEITRREGLAHVLEHAAMHLGQIQVTRGLVSRG